MVVVREGGLLLTEEKRCRLASEDNCTDFAIYGCAFVCATVFVAVCICCRCALVHAIFFSPLFLSVCGSLCVCVCVCVSVITTRPVHA